MERPKFCVGELVGIESVMRPDLNCSRTEIIRMGKFDGTLKNGRSFSGWVYRVRANRHWWCEPALRKLDKRNNISFEEMVTNLGKAKASTKSDAIVEPA